MSKFYAMCMHFIFITLVARYANAVESNMNKDSECYSPNGIDYTGTQSTTYVKGSGSYEPTEPDIEECLPWKDQTLLFNTSMELPENYCRNPNDRLFPWCFVMRGSLPTFSYCHIPTCSTPALLGCFKLAVTGEAPSNVENVTNSGPLPDLILDGEDSMLFKENLRIGGCLNYCRSREYNYAGVTGGNSCMCGKEEADGPQMRDSLNHLPPIKCLQYECTGDRMQACGGDDAMAIYDVDAGSCGGIIFEKDSGVIYSPRWPGKYAHNLTCGWTIYIPDKYIKDEKMRNTHKINFSFRYFNLEAKNDTLKIYTYKDSTDTNSKRIANFSGNYIPAPVEQDFIDVIALHIVFHSDEDHKHDGFIMLFNITNLDGEVETTLPPTVTNLEVKTTLPPTVTNLEVKTTLPPTDNPTPSPTSTVSSSSTTTSTQPTEPGKIAGATKSTTTNKNATEMVQTKPVTSKTQKNTSLDSGKIAGIVIGVLVFLILAGLLVAMFLRYKRNQAPKDLSTDDDTPKTFNNPVSFNAQSNL